MWHLPQYATQHAVPALLSLQPYIDAYRNIVQWELRLNKRPAQAPQVAPSAVRTQLLRITHDKLVTSCRLYLVRPSNGLLRTTTQAKKLILARRELNRSTMPLNPSRPGNATDNVTAIRSMQAVRMLRSGGLDRPTEHEPRAPKRTSTAQLAAETSEAGDHGPGLQQTEALSFEARHVAEDVDAPLVAALKRGVALTSDAIVLTLASPFFAIWALQRLVRSLRNGRDPGK